MGTRMNQGERARCLLVPRTPRLSRLSLQMSHLFNVAHTLRMLVQKERSLDILKVRWARGGCPGAPWGTLCPWAPLR